MLNRIAIWTYRHQMVEITVGRCCKFEGSEADVVQGLVVDAERLVRVLHQLKWILMLSGRRFKKLYRFTDWKNKVFPLYNGLVF